MSPVRIDIEAEQHAPLGFARIAHFESDDPLDQQVPGDDLYRLDMALTSRPPSARGRLSRRWEEGSYKKLGNVWLSLPNEPMRFCSEAGRTKCVQCALNPEAVVSRLGKSMTWSATVIDGVFDLSGARFRALLHNLAEELSTNGLAADAMIELLLGQVAIELGRHLTRTNEGHVALGLAASKLAAIKQRIAKTGAPPTLEELAALCGLSVRQLTRSFKASTGRSIGQAISEQRVASAKQLLASNLSAKVIAHRLGYASPAGFSYAFHKATGETPRGFRSRRAGGVPDA